MKRIAALLLTFILLFVCMSCHKDTGDETTTATVLTSELAETATQDYSADSSATETQTSESTTQTDASLKTESRTQKTTTQTIISAVVTTVKTTVAKTTVKALTTKAAITKATTKKASTTARQSTAAQTTVKETTTAAKTSTTAQPEARTCTITISCAVLLGNTNKLKDGKAPFVPSDGMILEETIVEFKQGETAFDILKKACASGACSDSCQYCESSGIQLEYSYSAGYGNYYIEGIHQLYEKDCGSKSGWMYKVNGVFADTGCSSYAVKNGDKIEFVYTCNLGEDIGANI